MIPHLKGPLQPKKSATTGNEEVFGCRSRAQLKNIFQEKVFNIKDDAKYISKISISKADSQPPKKDKVAGKGTNRFVPSRDQNRKTKMRPTNNKKNVDPAPTCRKFCGEAGSRRSRESRRVECKICKDDRTDATDSSRMRVKRLRPTTVRYQPCSKIRSEPTRHREKNIQCMVEGCDQKFQSKSFANTHYKIAHLQHRHICLKCSKQYTRPVTFMTHSCKSK